MGHDSSHKPDDPLWDSDEVRCLLKLRQKRSQSAEKEAKREHNRRYYAEKRNKMRETQTEILDGKITPEEAHERLTKYSVGWHRQKLEIMKLKDQINSKKEIGATMAEGNNVQSRELLEEEFRIVTVNQAKVEHFNRSNRCMVSLFCNRSLPNWGVPLFPTGVTPSDYFHYLALFLPMSLWDDDHPLSRRNLEVVRSILSDDKQFCQENLVADFIRPADRDKMLQRFNISADAIYAQNLDGATLMKLWKDTQLKIQRSFFPISDRHSPVLFHHLLSQACSFQRDRDDID